MRIAMLAAAALAGCQDQAAAPAPAVTAQTVPGGASLAPTAFQGEWNADLSACGAGASETKLIITGRDLRFYESRQTIVSASQSSESDISLQTMAVGEGQVWTDSFRFRLSADGGSLTDVASGLVRRRCPG